MRAKVERAALGRKRRILAISDIHGNLEYFRGVLKKAEFGPEDILFLVGDMLEKGPESLKTLRFIMELTKKYSVYPILGNCDGYHMIIDCPTPEMDEATRSYMQWRRDGTLAQMCGEAGIPVTPDMDMDVMRRALRIKMAPELDFLRSLPHVVETENFYFVHGGLPSENLEGLDAKACMKNDNFLGQGKSFSKYCVVGHWPVMLYGGDFVSANPVIERERRIISIDGGCVLKDDGQLNCLIIPNGFSEDFSWVYYDKFPVKTALDGQRPSERSAYFRFGDNVVEILERGEEFSKCRHVRTGYVMDILTKYLREEKNRVVCNDCSDYELEVSPGDRLSVVEETSRGCYVKKNGVSGWYRGRLA